LTVGSAGLEYELVKHWEHLPDGFIHFDVPSICTDSQCNVYLVCRGNRRVITYDRDGTCIDAWGPPPTTARAHGSYSNDDRTIFLVDEGEHSVSQYSLDGSWLLRTIGSGGTASDSGYDGRNYRTITRGAPPFNRPTGLCIGPTGDLYVSDGYGNCRVHRFAGDGSLIHSWGDPGRAEGQFYVPHAVWCHRDGRVFVADRENERIQIFDSEGRYLSEWADVQRPQGIFIDSDDTVYVAEGAWPREWQSQPRGWLTDPEPGRISIYDLDGNVLARWSQPDPTDEGYLLSPHGIWVDDERSIYIATNVGTFGEIFGESRAEAVIKYARI
jgi:NHL repeat